MFGSCPKPASTPRRLAVWIPGSHPGGRRSALARGDHLVALAQSVEASGLSPDQSRFESEEPHHARVAQSVEARGREPRLCRFESDRAYQFAPVAQSGRGAALRTRRFAVRVRAGVPMEGAARWLATGPENQGDRKGQGFDSSAFRQSRARKQTGALRPVAKPDRALGFPFRMRAAPPTPFFQWQETSLVRTQRSFDPTKEHQS